MRSVLKRKKTIATIVGILFSITGLLAQSYLENPKYGPDSATRLKCVKNLSLYREFVKQNAYKDAIGPWEVTFNICPNASKNIYIDGIKIVRFMIEKAETDEEANALIDSLMKVYDQRIKYYGQKGYVLGRKGVDFLRYRKSNLEDIEFGYNTLKESIKLRGMKSEEAVLVTFMTASETLFKADKIDREEMIGNYARTMEIVDHELSKNPGDQRAQLALKSIDAIFERSEAATCESLVNLFGKDLKDNKENKEWLGKVHKLLNNAGCDDESLYFDVTAAIHEIEPSSESAYGLARMARERENFEKAIDYYKQAIELEENNKVVSGYYTELGDFMYRRLDNLQKAREYAYKAIEADNTNGRPYLLIGNIYASIDNYGENEVEKKAVYWIAVDKYKKAMEVDPALSEEAERQIKAYTQYFPEKENAFFYGLNDGDMFTVGSWIDEKTRVRTR